MIQKGVENISLRPFCYMFMGLVCMLYMHLLGVRRSWYALYGIRSTMCITAAVQCAWRPPYDEAYAENIIPYG